METPHEPGESTLNTPKEDVEPVHVDRRSELLPAERRMERLHHIMQEVVNDYRGSTFSTEGQKNETGPAIRVEQKSPQDVLRKVEAAAEHNDPIERAYERRHEVKDKLPQSMSTDYTIKDTDVASKSTRSQSATFLADDSSPVGDSKTASSKPRLITNDLYRRAIYKGFAGGVIVLGVVILYLLLVKMVR
jgi:hypothetical protein